MHTVALGAFVSSAAAARGDAIRTLRADVGLPRFGPADPAGLDGAARGEYDRRMAEIDGRWPAADVATFVDHIDYAVELIGLDHVGISSDFDGGGGVMGWNHAGETFNVTLELVRRGYTEAEIAQLWGGNLLRVLRAVERVGGGQPLAAIVASGSAWRPADSPGVGAVPRHGLLARCSVEGRPCAASEVPSQTTGARTLQRRRQAGRRRPRFR